MIFNDKHMNVKNGDIVYLCEYVPVSRCKERDQRSESMVLAFKNKGSNAHEYMIHYIADTLAKYLEKNCALVAIPSSKAEKNEISSNVELIQQIMLKIGKSHNLTDASDCLYRKYDIPSQHLSTGKRDKSTLIESTGIRYVEKIQGKDVLVIDDITTSGNSFQVADELLRKSGAKNVVNFAVGKTIQLSNMNVGFILDLDGTLFDTRNADWYRNCRKWKEAIEVVKHLAPLPGATELLQLIKKSECKYCVVTSSPSNYAHVLTRKLNIPDNNVISYHDTARHKPDIEPYMRAKQFMQLYEPFIITIGNEDSDIVPAEKLGITSVFIGSEASSADIKFSSIKDCAEHFDDMVKNAKEIWNILASEYEKEHAPRIFKNTEENKGVLEKEG